MGAIDLSALTADEQDTTDDTGAAAYAPVSDTVTHGGRTLAVIGRPGDGAKLNKLGKRSGKGTAESPHKWRPTSSVLDIAHAVAGGLLTA